MNEEARINRPEVTLHPCGTAVETGNLFEDLNDTLLNDDNAKPTPDETTEESLKKERVAKVFELLDPATLKHLNEEEISHIKELIAENPFLFNLPGEKLKATHLVSHKIELASDVIVK